jgi:hypothetical protein
MGLDHVIPKQLQPRDRKGRAPDDPSYRDYAPSWRQRRTPVGQEACRQDSIERLRRALSKLENPVEKRTGPAQVISLADARRHLR